MSSYTVPLCELQPPPPVPAPRLLHKAGRMLIQCQVAGSPFEMRVCVDCLDTAVADLKEGGATGIFITAPESPAYGSWRR